MRFRTRWIVVTLLGGLLGTIARAEPTTQELLEEIQALRSRVEMLEARLRQQTGPTSAEVDTTIEQVMRDAERRSRWFHTNNSILAGWEDGRFFLRSDDNRFLLVPAAQLQIRHATNFREADDGDRVESGLELRRTKVFLTGHAFDPRLTYQFQWASGTADGDLTLEQAWVRYEFDSYWAIRAGQFKDVTFHEERTSSRRLLAADRSLVNQLIGGGVTKYVQGVTGIYGVREGPIRVEAGITDGIDSANTRFRDPPATDSNFGLVARADWFVHGPRSAYDDFTARGNKQGLLVFGAGAHWDQAPGTDTLFHTLDVQWENDAGLGAYGALLGMCVDDGSADYHWGLLTQLAYMLTDQWELFGRYDVTFLDGAVVLPDGATEDIFHEFTVGLNYYLKGHALKFTIDVTYLPNGAPSDEPGLSILRSGRNSFIVRGQLQFLL